MDFQILFIVNQYTLQVLKMTVTANYFTPLPEVLLANIFEFASDGPKKLAFDAKKKAFVEKINKNFTLLTKALQFKIDNPPHMDVDDPNFDYNVGTTELDIIENLTFKYPLKLRIRPGCRDQFYTNEGYLELTFSYSKSFQGYRTNKCTVSLPKYYIKNTAKAAGHFKEQLKKKLSKKDWYKAYYMYKGFMTLSYGPDLIFL